MSLLPLFTTLLIAAAPAEAPKKELNWVGCDISKLSFMDTVAGAYEKKTGVKISLVDGGATRGIREVVAKKADIGGTCRHAENVPEEQGVKLIPVAWDALVVAVHPSNPVNEITLEQVKGIFLGKITNWKQLGGPDRAIVAMERKGTLSGVGAGARELIFKDRKLQYHASVKLYESTRPLEEALEGTPDGITLTGVSSARLRKVKMLRVEGKAPTRENLISGAYLLYRPLYLTVPSAGASQQITDFMKYILSAEGQSLISSTGTVSLNEGKNLWPKYKAAVQDVAY